MRPGAKQFFERRVAPPPALPYDAEVKWLESTGTQWIDTGLPAREGLLVECVGNIVSWTSNGRLFGCTSGGRGREFVVQTGRLDTTQLYIGSAYAASYTTSIPIGQSSHVFGLDTTAGAKSFSVDGVVQQTWSTSFGVSLANIFLFSESASGYASVSRISSFLVKDATTGRTLVDLIPVRFTNELGESEGAMYDKVSGQLFRNAGTGKFIVGADADMPYDFEVAYVQYHQADFGVACKIPLPAAVLARFPSGTKFNQIDFSSRATVSRVDSGGNILGIGYTSAVIPLSPCAQGAADPPDIVAGMRAFGRAIECSTLDDYHSVYTGISSGLRFGSIDGVYGDGASSVFTSAIVSSYLSFFHAPSRASSSTGTGTIMRQSDVWMKVGNDVVVDGRPVVDGNGNIGWYNSVDKKVYSESPTTYPRLTAGPVVSNEGPVPYAYKVEYIETDGVASYIDTGVEFGQGVRLLFNFAFVGEHDSTGAAGSANYIFNFQQGWNSFRCSSNYIVLTSFSFDTSGSVFYECEIQYFSGDKIAKVDGNTVGTSTTTTAPILPGSTFVIGARNYKGSINGVGHVKCAKFQIFDHDGNCKFNGIPVVDRNGVACMYDYISKTLKYNAAATGTIVAGPRV